VSPPSRPHRRFWLLLLVPLLASIGTRDWWAPDEPRYAQVAREIYESGEFLVMHLCGSIYRSKPPLLFWISGALGQLADWSEWALRLPSLISTLVCALLTAQLARRFWGEDEARWAPILYLSTTMVAWHGARMQIDPLLSALTLGAIVAASEPCDTQRARARRLLAAGLLCGLGVLAKGPIALILFAVPLAGWRWILGPHAQRAGAPAWAAFAFAALAPGLAWASAVVARRPELAYDLFVGQFFERAVIGTNHHNPPWYHALVQPAMMLPWTLPMLAGSWWAWRALQARRRGHDFDAGLALAGWWFWALFLAFSLSPEKRELYLLPAYPALGLLGARWLCETVRAGRLARALVTPIPLLLLLTGIAICAAPFFENLAPEDIPQLSWQPLALGLPMALGAAIALRQGWRGHHSSATLALASGLALAGTLTALVIYPLANPLKSARSLSQYLSECEERPTSIPAVGVMPEGYRYYSRLNVVHGPHLDAALSDPIGAQETAFLALAREQGAQFLALVRRDDFLRWSEATRSQLKIRHEQLVGGRAVLVLGAHAGP